MRKRKKIKKLLAVLLASTLVVGNGIVTPAATKKPTKLTVKAKTKTLYVGGPASKKKTKITVKVKPAKASAKVTFKSSNKKVLTVTKKGVVTAKKKGTAKVTITSKVNKKLKKTIKFKVKKYTSASTTTASTGSTTDTSSTTDTTNTQSTFAVKSSVKAIMTGVNGTPNVAVYTGANAADLAALTLTSSDSEVVRVNADKTVTAVGTGKAVVTVTKDGVSSDCAVTVIKTTTAIHDPSVFKDPKSGKYYCIGTQLGMAVSTNLQAWSATTSGVNLLANGFATLSPLTSYTGGSSIADIWAADLYYNEKSGKYCMYVCSNGTVTDSSISNYARVGIAVLYADNITGPYTYGETLVCSTWANTTYRDKTNLLSALGLSSTDDIPDRYTKGLEVDAIDPHVYEGHDGNLYMVYGSFTNSGTINIIKLDPKTGGRNANYNYGYEAGVSDPYFGKILTKKSYGEGPYILKVKDTSNTSSTGYYYYMWTSCGTLRGTGTYQMWMTRSESPDGPFVDCRDVSAINSGYILNQYNYKFSFMDMAYTAMGGNSALVDDDGKLYLVYHNKFEDNSANPGTHMVKTHQMFVNSDGWLVTAPFEYHGESIGTSYETSSVAGDYELMIHKSNTAVTVGNYNYNYSQALKLNADGSLGGALSGTWKLSGNNITITAGSVTYTGKVLEQYEDDGTEASVSALDKTIVFTALGDNAVNIWGSKVTATGEEATAYDASKISLVTEADDDFTLPTSGLYGSTIRWSSSNTAVIAVEGANASVTLPDKETIVTLTATVTSGTSTITKDYKVTVAGYDFGLPEFITSETVLEFVSQTPAGTAVTWTSSNPSIINVTSGAVKIPETATVVTVTASYGGNTCVTDIKVGTLNPIYTQDYESVTDISTVWASQNASNKLSIANDSTMGKYASFSFAGDTKTNSRGAESVIDFGSTTIDSVYMVTVDAYLKAGNNQGSEFALMGNDAAYVSNNKNYGLASGYILKLNTTDSTTWTINDGDTVTIPNDAWVTIIATVNTNTGVVNLTIKDKSTDNLLYSGKTKVNGSGVFAGVELLAGRYQSVFGVDNIKVY